MWHWCQRYIGNGCPGQTNDNHHLLPRFHSVSHPTLTSTFSPADSAWLACYEICAVRWEAPYDLRDQIIFGAASPLSKSGEAWDILGRGAKILHWDVVDVVCTSSQAFGSLLTAWPVLLAVFAIAPWQISLPITGVLKLTIFGLPSGVPRTPVTNKACGHTCQTDGLLCKFSISETLHECQLLDIASRFWIIAKHVAQHPGSELIHLIAEATLLSILFLLLMTYYAGPVLFIAIVLADILIFLLGVFFAMGIFFDPFNTVGWGWVEELRAAPLQRRRLCCETFAVYRNSV